MSLLLIYVAVKNRSPFIRVMTATLERSCRISMKRTKTEILRIVSLCGRWCMNSGLVVHMEAD